MAVDADHLHEDQSVKDVVGRLLTAMESLPARPATAGGPAVFLFSSLRQGQGTSTIASAVARALSDTGRRTVLAVSASATSESVPVGSVPLHQVLEGEQAQEFQQARLLTLEVPARYEDYPAGARNPHDWLGASDVVIVDAPGLHNGLTRYWVPSVEGVVLVVDGERVSVRAVVEARDNIAGMGGHLVGVVLNRFRSRIPRVLEPYLDCG